MPKTSTAEPEAVTSDLPPDTTPGEPIAPEPAPDPEPAVKPLQRSAMDDPAHPLHHLRNA